MTFRQAVPVCTYAQQAVAVNPHKSVTDPRLVQAALTDFPVQMAIRCLPRQAISPLPRSLYRPHPLSYDLQNAVFSSPAPKGCIYLRFQQHPFHAESHLRPVHSQHFLPIPVPVTVLPPPQARRLLRSPATGLPHLLHFLPSLYPAHYFHHFPVRSIFHHSKMPLQSVHPFSYHASASLSAYQTHHPLRRPCPLPCGSASL